MPTPYTLAVIDMQQSFGTANKRSTVAAVSREIEAAISLKNGIVVVEYEQESRTHPDLLRLLKRYPHWERIRKDEDDGGEHIFDAIIGYGFGRNHIKVTGVNREACVQASLITLAKLLPSSIIEVVGDATNGHGCFDRRKFRKYPNVKFDEFCKKYCLL